MEKEIKDINKTGIFLSLLIIFIIILLLSEVILIGYSFIKADKVECDWFHCVATDNNYYSVESFNECYMNGIKVNCSEMGSPYG